MSHKVHHGHGTIHVPIKKNFCFGCGQDNPQGMRLKFALDAAGKRFVARFRLGHRYVGPPEHAHGGVIATILDEAMGKVNKLRQVIALTSEMTVQYLKPVPLGRPLIAEGWERHVRGRIHINVAEIRNERGEVLARSRGKFIAIDPEKKFAEYIKRSSQFSVLSSQSANPAVQPRVRPKNSGATMREHAELRERDLPASHRR